MESELTKVNRKFNLADSLAGTLLEGKTDKHGIPLIIHCRSVCNRCKDLSDEQRLAALLHEVLEEGERDSFSKEDISRTILGLFGWSVLSIVLALTRDKQKERYRAYIVNMSLRSKAAVPVKIADLEDNLDESRGEIKESLKERYTLALEMLYHRV